MEGCNWNGCVWGAGHEGPHQTRAQADAEDAANKPIRVRLTPAEWRAMRDALLALDESTLTSEEAATRRRLLERWEDSNA